MTRALVTGASGFLGRHLVRHLLAEGWEVTALQRESTVDSLAAEASDGLMVVPFADAVEAQQLAREAAPDRVFHLATLYLKDHRPEDIDPLFAANVLFGTHLLEGLRGSGAVVLNANSFFQFRDSQPRPYSLYSASKQSFLDVCAYYREVAGLDIRQVVLFDTFGPRDTRDKLVPALMRAARTRSSVTLGPSAQQLNLLFSQDVVTALVAATEDDAPPMMAIRAERATTVGELVTLVGEVSSAPLTASFNDGGATSDVASTSGDWPVPPRWKAKHSLREGLALTFAQAD